MPVLGVDGGNTKTVAVVASEDGRVLDVAVGGCTDVYGATSIEAALEELYRVIGSALEASGVGPSALAAAALSLAGADWDEDFALQAATAAERLPGVPVEIVNDAVGPIRCAAREGVGVSAIFGTGAAIGARGHDGQAWHVGFTPRHSGAHGLAREALAAVQEADMGCGPPTALTGRLLGAFGVDEPRAILHAVTRRGGLDALGIAALAPLVLDEADRGDRVAVGIVEQVGHRMGCWTRHAATRVGLDADHTLVLAGGLLQSAGSGRLLDAALAETPEARPTVLRAPPVLGAVLMALDRAGATVDESALGDDLLRGGLLGASPRHGVPGGRTPAGRLLA